MAHSDIASSVRHVKSAAASIVSYGPNLHNISDAKSSYHLGVTSPFPFQQELRDDVHHAIEHAKYARRVEARRK